MRCAFHTSASEPTGTYTHTHTHTHKHVCVRTESARTCGILHAEKRAERRRARGMERSTNEAEYAAECCTKQTQARTETTDTGKNRHNSSCCLSLKLGIRNANPDTRGDRMREECGTLNTCSQHMQPTHATCT